MTFVKLNSHSYACWLKPSKGFPSLHIFLIFAPDISSKNKLILSHFMDSQVAILAAHDIYSDITLFI